MNESLTRPDPDPVRTRALVDRAHAGDSAAYDELFARHQDRLTRYVRLALGPELGETITVEDAVQETFLLAHEAFERFEERGRGSFGGWLCRIAQTALLRGAEHFAAAKRRHPGVAVRMTLAQERLQASGVNPVRHASLADELERLEGAIAGLEGEARQAILMRHFEERTLAEIAAELLVTESSARRLLGRAMRDVAGAMSGSESPDE